MATRKKIPLIDASASLAVTGSVTIAGSGSAVITFPSTTSTLATTTGTQELTNKTIVAGNNTISGIANANLSTTAGDIGGVWKSWTPTLTNLSGGTLSFAKYTQIGKTIIFKFRYVLGNAGVGNNPNFTTPTNIAYTGSEDSITQSVKYVIGGATTYGHIRPTGANVLTLYVQTASGSYVGLSVISSTVPATWAANDILSCSGVYEVA